ncbi:MAG: hypothetical protein ACI8RD_011499 [Bacillariaceae sp.]|jgi:hypothetical protein
MDAAWKGLACSEHSMKFVSGRSNIVSDSGEKGQQTRCFSWTEYSCLIALEEKKRKLLL